MILGILTLLSALFELAKVVVEKFVPERQCPTIRKGLKKPIEFARGITIDQIAKIGKKKGIV